MTNWCIVIPYRNREEHLKKFLAHYQPLFPDVEIYVIEQADDKPFNRAKLFNCFFCLFGEMYDYAAYHDVDMYVRPEYISAYSFPDNPTHICTKAQQFGYQMPYPEYFGGVTLLSKDQMLKSGGFSNEFWSRQAEDDELRNNLISKGFSLDSRKCIFECEEHPRPIDPNLYPKNLELLRNGRGHKDGVQHCQFEFVNIQSEGGYHHVFVKL